MKTVSREMLAAWTNNSLLYWASFAEPMDEECRALVDCEWLRRGRFYSQVVARWEGKTIPPSVPELQPLLNEAKARLGGC